MDFKILILFTIGILLPILSRQEEVTFKLKRSIQSRNGCKLGKIFDNELVYESNGLNFYDVNQDVILEKKINVSLPRKYIVLNNGFLAVAEYDDKTLSIWDAEKVVKVLSLEISKTFFNTVKDLIQLKNDNLVTITYGGEVKVWNINNGSLVTSLPKSGRIIQTIALPGNRLAIVYQENNLIIWSSEGKIIHELKEDPSNPTRIKLIYSLPSGSLLYNFNNSVYALDLEKLDDPVLVIPNSGEVLEYSLSDNGYLAVAEKISLNNGFFTTTVKIYTSDTFELVKTFGFKGLVNDIVTLSNGYLATVLMFGSVVLIDLVNLEQIATISNSDNLNIVSLFGFSDDVLAVCKSNEKIDIWTR